MNRKRKILLWVCLVNVGVMVLAAQAGQGLAYLISSGTIMVVSVGVMTANARRERVG